jgi:hypothetical protein
MTQTELIIQTVYTVIVVVLSLVIYSKCKKVYKISGYDGIRYFQDAFLYYAAGFTLNYILTLLSAFNAMYPLVISILSIIAEYTLGMAGFFLVYSLVWKSFPSPTHVRVSILHILALLIGILDLWIGSVYVLYISQLAIFIYASFLAYQNYMSKKQPFQQVFFIIMILVLLGWIANFVAYYANADYPFIIFYVYALTTFIFIALWYSVERMTKGI